jgi:hypothetical protein
MPTAAPSTRLRAQPARSQAGTPRRIPGRLRCQARRPRNPPAGREPSPFLCRYRHTAASLRTSPAPAGPHPFAATLNTRPHNDATFSRPAIADLERQHHGQARAGVTVLAQLTVGSFSTGWAYYAANIAVTMPALMLLFSRIQSYYQAVGLELDLGQLPHRPPPAKNLAIVPVGSISKLTEYAADNQVGQASWRFRSTKEAAKTTPTNRHM